MAGISRLPNGKYRPRYRDEHGKERACHLDRKVDAQRWLDEVTAAMVTGTYVDPSAGRHNFAEYYAEWSARQVWAPGTEAAMSLAARTSRRRRSPPSHAHRRPPAAAGTRRRDGAPAAQAQFPSHHPPRGRQDCEQTGEKADVS
jgi:hypothetical protein